MTAAEDFDPRPPLAQQIAVLGSAIIPLIGFVAAVVIAWGRGLHVSDVVAFVTMYFVVGIGLVAGFHRLFAHVSFNAKKPLRIFLAVTGSMAIMAPLIVWASVHRRHHAHSDVEGDPHSPHVGFGDDWRGHLRGLYHAHMGWMMIGQRFDFDRWVPDLLRDRAIVLVDRLYFLWVFLSLVIPAVIGWVVSGYEPMGAFTGMLWGGLVRAVVFNHIIYAVSSICHMYGKQPFDTRDKSVNNAILALPSLGESWHNNHHAFPGSATNQLSWWQIDITGIVIRSFVILRLATDMHVPTEDTVERRLRQSPR